MKLRLSKRATEQIRAADAWWQENRGDSHLLREEVGRALALLRETPHIGARDSKWPQVRRWYLRRVRYFIYYRVEDSYVDVLAFWHDARGTSPLES